MRHESRHHEPGTIQIGRRYFLAKNLHACALRDGRPLLEKL